VLTPATIPADNTTQTIRRSRIHTLLEKTCGAEYRTGASSGNWSESRSVWSP